LRGSGAYARKLQVTSEGLALREIPEKPDLCIGWTDPRLKIEIVDVSGWPRGGKEAGEGNGLQTT